jgi:hypothetical protein
MNETMPRESQWNRSPPEDQSRHNSDLNKDQQQDKVVQ